MKVLRSRPNRQTWPARFQNGGWGMYSLKNWEFSGCNTETMPVSCYGECHTPFTTEKKPCENAVYAGCSRNNTLQVINGVPVSRSLIFCVLLCRSMFVPVSLFILQLCYLSFIDLLFLPLKYLNTFLTSGRQDGSSDCPILLSFLFKKI